MAATCLTKIQLIISAKNLADEDVLSKSDPFAVVLDARTRKELGRTEVVKDNLNPTFTKAVVVDYYFETKQQVILALWDYDNGGNHDPLGQVEFTLGQLMSTRGSTLTLPMKQGQVTVTGVTQGQTRGTVNLAFRGRQLRNMDTFSKSDPFYTLHRILPNGSLQQLYKSEVIDNNLDPFWKPQPPVELASLCSGNMDAKLLKFTCYDEDLTENEYMGEFVCSVNDLLAPNAEFRLVDAKNASEFYGYIHVARIEFKKRIEFLDLLKAGLQLNIAFSIDFTGSNLEPKNPKSLHYYHPTQPNQYVQAMIAVSDVVQEYDSDRQFPVFGFGAILPGSHEANHFFNLNLGANPYISGMQAVIDTYVQTVQQIRLYGPTNFAPTIRNVVTGARQAQGVYTILLIITDGEITDMDDTITEIVNADDAPISILIVGVGAADFGSMDQLDCDSGMLRSSTGRVSRRDTVQFVPMRDYLNRPGSDVAAALLAEIPDQVSKWAELNPQAVAPFLAATQQSVGPNPTMVKP